MDVKWPRKISDDPRYRVRPPQRGKDERSKGQGKKVVSVLDKDITLYKEPRRMTIYQLLLF